MNHIDIEAVKTRYTMPEILERLGIEKNRTGFICCPFHNEDTASCKIYEYSFYCFGCGVGGDVIDFIKRYLNLSFADALEWLGGTNISFAEARKIKNRKREYEAAESAKKEISEKYNALMDEWCRLDKQRREFAPLSPNDPLDKRFIEAIQNISRIESELDGLTPR